MLELLEINYREVVSIIFSNADIGFHDFIFPLMRLKLKPEKELKLCI